MNKKGAKIIAGMLVFMMMFSYLSIVHEVVAASADIIFKVTLSDATIFVIGIDNMITVQAGLRSGGYLSNVRVRINNGFTSFERSLSNQVKSGEIIEQQIPIDSFIPKEELVNPKEFNTQLEVSLLATYVNASGEQQEIEMAKTFAMGWTVAEKEANLDMEVTKFIPYQIEDKSGVMLQTRVTSGLRANRLPVAQEKIEISVPTINNIKPETVKVFANSTKATNGDEEGINFKEENYTYNKEEGKLTITVVNTENEDGKVSWAKNCQDEFVVTYIYPEGTNVKESTTVDYSANVELTLIDASTTKATKTIERQTTLTEQIGKLVDLEVETNIETISKGQIYANYNASNKIDTTYEEKIIANISMADLIDTVVINANQDNFVKQDDTKESAQNNTYYKELVIEKANFDKILSEDGFIKIYNGEALISTIDKTVVVNEEGKIVVDLKEFNVSQIKLETSDVKAEGKLEVTLNKVLRGDLSIALSKIQEVTALELNATLTANSEELAVVEQTQGKQITLTEPTTDAEVTIEPTNLSTVVVNNDVKIKAILKTDTLDSKLYKDPTLNIILPKYIENINIKNVEVLFETEGTKLTLKEYKLIPNADGTKTLKIVLEGTQTEYSLGSVSKGLNVVVTSDITVNKFSPNREENIVMNYINNYISKEEKQAVAKVNFVAPTGIVAISTVSNYAENASAVTTINSEEKVVKIPTMQETRNARFEMNLINNYSNTIDNVVILGRLPFESNQDVVTSVSLGTTFDMALVNKLAVSGVDASKVKVYYSENGNATKDLTNAANGWKAEITDLSKVKSYLIVLENYTMATGEGISFAYDAKIPEGLQHNESAYQNYVAYFNNNMASGTIKDQVKAAKLGITTGTGAVIEAKLESNVEGTKELQAEDLIKYTVTVKNTGTENAENVKVNVKVPNNLRYIQLDEESISGYKTIATQGKTAVVELGTLEAGSSIKKELLMKVESIVEDTAKVETKVAITSDSIEGEIASNVLTNTIVKTYYQINSSIENDDDNISIGDEYKYAIYISSPSSYNAIEDTILEIDIPEELEYKEIQVMSKKELKPTDITENISKKYDKKTRKLTIELDNIENQEIKIVYLTVKVQKLEDNVYSKTLELNAKVSGKDTRAQEVKLDKVEINKLGFKVSQTSNITENAEITAYEDFKYVFTVENLSNLQLYNVKVTDTIPEGLTFKNAKITYNSGMEDYIYELDENGKANIELNIMPKETVTIEVNVLANGLQEDKQITNTAKVSYENVEYATSNSISHTIKKYEVKESEITTTKRIMGQVWEDKNANGVKDEDETKFSNVEVMLFDNKAGDFVKDSEGKIIKTLTSEDGIYTITNIKEGKYTVVFLYDNANYSATTYRKENVDESRNSDALDSKIAIDGVTRIAAITEEIQIKDSNIYNIDLGLVANKKFDLKLDKTVSKITVQDSEGIKVYEYEDTKLAKKDLSSKKVNDTTIVVEYKIKVTNEGAVAGYVKKIVDYMPEEMKFSSELNRDWYVASNGDLYNSSLANTIINPGETKEVTLTLSKKMSEDTLGLINNTAEIYEAYNDLGLKDVDSKEANKISEEDDMSGADILITVKTGETIMFIGLSITIIATITIAAYFIKKKVLV